MAAEHVARIGARIRYRREELEMTQSGLARQLPGTVDGNQVSRWERGLHKPSDETLELIAGILGVDYSYFVKPDAPVKDLTPDLMEAVNGNVTNVGSTVDDIREEFRGLVNSLAAQLNMTERKVDRNCEMIDRLTQSVTVLIDTIATQAAAIQRIEDVVSRGGHGDSRGESSGM